jgi:hypothetical protein
VADGSYKPRDIIDCGADSFTGGDRSDTVAVYVVSVVGRCERPRGVEPGKDGLASGPCANGAALSSRDGSTVAVCAMSWRMAAPDLILLC